MHSSKKQVRRIVLCGLTGILIFPISCKKKSTTGAGTFPNFYTKTKEAAPSVKTSSTLSVLGSFRAANYSAKDSSPFRLLAVLPSTYSTSVSEFTTGFSASENYIGQILNDAGLTGPVKSMYVLLSQAQTTVESINTTYSDSLGNPRSCTAISSTTTVTTPFFATATTTPITTWVDTGKYTCYAAQGTTGRLIFGRQAITSPTSGCTDAYEYYVISGSSKQNETNTESVSTRGPTKNLSSIQKFYYNGCTTDIKLIYAQSTKYSLGVEFSSRTELLGNTTAHSFTIRTNFIDADTTYATHVTAVGTGVSQPTSGTTAVNFAMGYRSDNCGTSSNSATCTAGTAYSFCAKNQGTVTNYALDTTTSNCSSLTSTYSAAATLERSDLPSTYFEAGTAAAYGL